MKNFILIVCFALKISATFTLLIDFLPQPCSKLAPNYNDCATKYLVKIGPRIFNGIAELNIPSFNPFHLSFYAYGTNVSNILSIKAIMKDFKLWNMDNIELRKQEFDTEKLTGETHYYFSGLVVTLKYDASGQLFSPVVLRNKGFFLGNGTDINVVYKYNYKTIEKNQNKYYEVDQMQVKINIQNAEMKITSKNPANQFIADLVQNTFNEDPSSLMDPFMSTIEKHVALVSKFVLDRVLGIIPAEEVLPP